MAEPQPSFNPDLPTLLRELLATQKDILATNYLLPLSSSYLPWTGYSMRPSGLVKVLNDIVLNKRSVIVECGGGISTIYIARILKSRGGHLYSIDHHPQWLELLEEQLRKEEISDYVSLICAPLVPTNLSWENLPWYNTEILKKKIPQELAIELLLVDGPPAYEKSLQHSRYPAVPYFFGQLAEDFTIIIDDVNRPGEQEIIKRWTQFLKVNFEIVEGDIAIATYPTMRLQVT
jgi:hypothetical protein